MKKVIFVSVLVFLFFFGVLEKGQDAESLMGSILNKTVAFERGGGVIIGENIVLTVGHIINWTDVNREGKVELKGMTYGGRFFKGEVIKSDSDLALIRTDMKFENWAKIGKAERGDDVIYVGHPLGMKYVIRMQKLSIIEREGTEYLLITSGGFGDSGGGVWNMKGELIGIMAKLMTYKTGDGGLMTSATFLFAYPSSKLVEFLK